MKGPSQATQLVELAVAAEFFHTPHGEPFASIHVGGHWETWPLRTGAFRRWLQREFHRATGTVPGAQAIQDALGVLEGRAHFEGPEEPVHIRLAEHGGAVYLDLADDDWKAVEINATGWEIVPNPPVRFRRPAGMLPLPVPESGGKVDDLRDFINVTDDDWPLVVASEVAALRPRGPYPVLPLHGEQGSAKSTTARVLRSLVDPNAVPLRGHPREERDLMIAARNGWVLAFDNVSHLPDWLSDAFCRLSTGGGLATRALYTDSDEVLFDATRPVLMTGIEELATRGDLLDRALVLYLPTIPERARRTEAEFWSEFTRARPAILGALLTAVSTAIRRERDVVLDRLPRLADFATWVTAAEPALGWPPGTFLTAYSDNRAEANELTLEASPIVPALRELADDGFTGTATDLLSVLAEKAWTSSSTAPGASV